MEVEQDFQQIRRLSIQVARICLVWEDFQPSPGVISASAIQALREVLDIASRHRVKILVSLFHGHMSGVNFVPPWILAEGVGETAQWPVFSGGQLMLPQPVRNIFREPDLVEAEKRLTHEVVAACRMHPALYGWELGGGLSRLFPLAETAESNGSPLTAADDEDADAEGEDDAAASYVRWSGRFRRPRHDDPNRGRWGGSLMDLTEEEVEENPVRRPKTERRPEPEPEPAPPPLSVPPPWFRAVAPHGAEPRRPTLGLANGIAVWELPAVTAEDDGPEGEYDFRLATPIASDLEMLHRPAEPSAAALPLNAASEEVTVRLGAAPARPQMRHVVSWVKAMVRAIREQDRTHPISLSLTEDDLDSPTPFNPVELAPHVDFVSFQAYSGTARWSRSPIDTLALPFTTLLAEGLTTRRIVLLGVGLPTVREEQFHSGRQLAYPVAHEQEAVTYYQDVMEGLLQMGALGFFAWNLSDFHPRLWDRPPLAQSPWERWSGLRHADGALKPTAFVVREFASWEHPVLEPPLRIRVVPQRFYDAPRKRTLEAYDQFLRAVGQL